MVNTYFTEIFEVCDQSTIIIHLFKCHKILKNAGNLLKSKSRVINRSSLTCNAIYITRTYLEYQYIIYKLTLISNFFRCSEKDFDFAALRELLPSRCTLGLDFCKGTCQGIGRKTGSCEFGKGCECSDERLSPSEFALCASEGMIFDCETYFAVLKVGSLFMTRFHRFWIPDIYK